MKRLWAKVNKCVVCGTNLKFEKSSRTDAEPEEGVKFCEQNHKRFNVYGRFQADGVWTLTFNIPL